MNTTELKNFGWNLQTTITPLAVVNEFDECKYEALYLLFTKNDILYTCEFMQRSEDTEIRHITSRSYKCIDIPNRALRRNPNYDYVFFNVDGKTTFESLFNTFDFLFDAEITKEEFLEKMNFTDMEEKWNVLFEKIKNSGQVPETIEDLLEGYI